MRSMMKRFICMWMCTVLVLGLVPDVAVQAATEKAISAESSEVVTSISTFSVRENNGNYFFTTFEDLKELTANTYEKWTVI